MLPRGRYRLMDSLCRKPITPFVRQLGIANGRVNFICDSRDGIAREVCFMGYYEPQETVLILRLLRAGMCFVDVGANWGYFTLLAADLVGPSGRVIAFEPHPTLYAQLQSNVLRNNLTWTTALPIAVADVEGEMTLAAFEEHTTNWGVSRLVGPSDANGPQFRVRTGLLEALLDYHAVSKVDMLKIDIEGAEALVVPTMTEGLSRGRYKRILLELHPAAVEERGLSPKNLIENLMSYGYRGWRVDHSRAAFRRAAYHLPDSPAEFLAPVNLDSSLDEWPHILFLAPDVYPAW
jgi:FkbM family methyltransferase